ARQTAADSAKVPDVEEAALGAAREVCVVRAEPGGGSQELLGRRFQLRVERAGRGVYQVEEVQRMGQGRLAAIAREGDYTGKAPVVGIALHLAPDPPRSHAPELVRRRASGHEPLSVRAEGSAGCQSGRKCGVPGGRSRIPYPHVR